MDDTPVEWNDVYVEWNDVYSYPDNLFADYFVGIADYNYHPDVAFRNTRQMSCMCLYHRERHGTKVRRSWVLDGAIDPGDIYDDQFLMPQTYRAIYRQKWEFMAGQVAVLPVPQ